MSEITLTKLSSLQFYSVSRLLALDYMALRGLSHDYLTKGFLALTTEWMPSSDALGR